MVDTLERGEEIREERKEQTTEINNAASILQEATRRAGVHQYRRIHPNWVPGRDAHADWESRGREGTEPVVPERGWMGRIRDVWESVKYVARCSAPYIIPVAQCLLSAGTLTVAVLRMVNVVSI